MRTFLKRHTLLFLSFLLSACIRINDKDLPKEHSYEEVNHLKIAYNTMFSQANQAYFVYFYSFYCGHCEHIKNDVIEFALSDKHPIYFVEYTSEIPILSNVENTIGAKNISDFGILGTPTIAVIKDYEVRKNIAGESNILSLLIEVSSD